MPFDLKNVEATCHIMMNKVFKEEIGKKKLEVYMDDMVVSNEAINGILIRGS